MLNDSDALQVFHALPREQDPTRKASMAQALGEYRDAKVAAGLRPFQPSPEEQRAKVERFERLYAGVDGIEANLAPEQRTQLDGMLATAPNPDEAKARMVNMAYLADTYGDKLPAGWNEANWPAVKRSFAKQALGIDKPEVSDTELFGAIGAKVEHDRAERTMLGKMVEGVTLAAFEGSGDYLEAYAKVAPSLEGDVGYDAASRDRYRAVAKVAFTQMKERADRLRPLAERIVTSLAREQGTQDMQGAMGFSVDALVDMVKDIPEEDRPLLYAVVARSAAKSPDTNPDKSLGEQSGEAIGRGIVGVLRAHKAALKDNPETINARMLAEGADRVTVAGERKPGESVLAWANRSMQGNYGIVDFVVDVATQNGQPFMKNRRKLTDDEQAALKDEVADMQRTRAIRKELRDIAEGVVDPIKGENFVTEKVLYPFLQNAAYSAQAFVPYAGLPLLISSTMGMRSEELMARGVPIEQAQKIALASAVVEAPVEMLQAKMVAGSLPLFKQLLEVPVAGLAQLAGRAAAVAGVQMLEQNVQEAAQDAAPLVLQHVASVLSENVPGVDWKKELKAYGAERVDTFWAMLPMVLIGTGTATFQDAAYGRQYLNSKTALKAAGFTEEAAVRILEAPSMEEKQALVREWWEDEEMRKTNSAAQRAAFEELGADLQASYAEANVEGGAKVSRLENGEWVVEDAAGETIDVASSADAALELARDYNAAQSVNTTQAIQDTIEYVERFQEAGQSIELVDGSRSLQDLADRGDFTQDEADAIVDTYVRLGRLEAGATAADALVTGENQVTRYDARRRIVEDVSRIYDGATPLTVIEEHAEGYLKRRLSAGDVTLEDVAGWRDSLGIEGRNDERSLVEFFSEQAQAYMVGKADAAEVPASFRAFLQRLREYFRRVLDLAARLMKAEADGTLPADFKTHLARSVGMDEAYVAGMYREQERAAMATDDAELSVWIKGRLPHPADARAAGEPLAGELEDLFNGMGNRQKAQAFFAKKGEAAQLDRVVEASREAGFLYQTPGELLAALDDSMRGIPQLPDYTVASDGSASFSLDAGGVAKIGGVVDSFKDDETGDGKKLPPLFGQSFGIESRKRVEEIQDGMKMRRVAERVAAAEHAGEAFGPAVRKAMEGLMYEVVPNKTTVAEALKVVDAHGVDEALNIVLSNTADYPPNVQVALGLGLMEHFNAVKNYEKASLVGERVAELGTELGRGVQVFSLLGRVLDTPEKAQVFLARQVKKAETALRAKQPAIDGAKEALVDIQAEALKLLEGWLDQINGVAGKSSALKPARVEDLPDLTFSLTMDMRRSGIVSTVARMLKESGAVETRKALVTRYGEKINPFLLDIFIEAQRQILQRASAGSRQAVARKKKQDEAAAKKKPRPTAPAATPKEIDAALDEVRKAARKSDVQLDVTAIDEHFRGKRMTPEQVQTVLDEARAAGVKVRQDLLDMPMGESEKAPLMTPEEVDAELAAIRADARKADVQLDMTAIDEHFRGSRLSPGELENVLATARAFGLGNQVQTQLAGLEELAQRFEDEVLARMKVRGLETPQAVRDAVRRLFDMKGVSWTAADIDRVFREKFTVPAATEAQKARLAELAQNIRSTPDRSAERTDATVELMNHVNDILKPVDAVDKAWAVWYANVLSGYNTHFRNLYANLLEQTIALPLDATRANPIETLQLMREMLFGVKAGASIGAAEAKRQLQTGDASILRTEANKFGTAGTLERVEFAGGRANPFNWLKVVGRALRAEDLFAYSTAMEAKARMVAWEMATQKGLEGEARDAEVARLLNATEEQIGDFRERAAREWAGLTDELKGRTTEKAWTERRVKELRLLERDAALIERASEFAARATFNYKPDGFVGIMANSLTDFLGRVSSIEASGRQEVLLKALATTPKLVVPFVRIVANVLNRGIDYTGLGVVRAAAPSKLSGSVARGVEFQAKSADERAMELKRGIFGIVALGVLSAMADPDDDKAPIQIHGAGSGNREKNLALHGPRWMPYSIEVRTSEGSKFITYQYSPLLLGLAIVGGWHDARRYRKLDEKEQSARLAVAVTGAGSVLLEQSFLSNAADVLNMFSRDGQVSERAVYSFLGRTFNPATVAVPFANLVANVARDFDPVQRDKTSIQAALLAYVPVAAYANEPALDVLGDPIPNRPLDWFVRAEQEGTPEARIYRAFAAKNVAPTSVWSYKGKMEPEQFYAFTRERGAWLKATLLANDARLLKQIEGATAEAAEAFVENLSRSATVFARARVGYKPEAGNR